EAAAARHLDVEEHHLGGELVDAGVGVVDVAGLADHLDAVDGPEQPAQFAAGEGFVVDDQRSHAGSRASAVACPGFERSSCRLARSPNINRSRCEALRRPTPSPLAGGSSGRGLTTVSTSWSRSIRAPMCRVPPGL